MQLREARRLSLTTAVAAVALAAATTTGGGHPVGPPGGGGWVDSGSAMSTTERMPKVPSVPVEGARVRGDKGTPRLSQSAYEHLDIPAEALLAYHAAAMVMADVDQGCGLSWTLLAAIGRVESDHGRYAGAQLLSDGTSSEPVRGVRLDGTGPVARIHDTDGGLLDGDRVWDRAVGPMQFLPSTWSVVAVDADGDGVRSPDDIHDAALAAAVFLCAEPGALDTAEGRRAAVFRYNPSDSYVASVLALERAYRAGEFDVPGEPVLPPPVLTAVALPPMPDLVGTSGRQGPVGDRDGGGQAAAEPVPDGADPDQDPDPGDGDPTTPESPEPPTGGPTDPPETPGSPDPSGPPEPGPTDGPDPDPSGPPDPPDSPDPPESPEPEPEPEPVAVTGVLTACGPDLAQWCLGDLVLDVGDDAFLAAPASADHDSDGAAESRSAELAGLAGTEVTVVVAPAIGPGFVVAVNGLAYDGR